jgi:alpha-mannosidase
MIDTIYLIHHSHTDIGFTAEQPIIWDLHGRFIERAMDLIEHDVEAGADDGFDMFRWTCETALPVLRWLRGASKAQRRRFQKWEAAGRIEVCAQPLHLAPLYRPAQLADVFDCVRALREDYGLAITSSMTCDVNGHNWPMADWLIDLGVTGQSMAINTHFGRAPLTRPLAFNWQAPSGRTLPTWNGFVYGAGNIFAQPPHAVDDVRTNWLPKQLAHLRTVGYALPILMIQAVDAFGDNGGPDPRLPPFVRAWNASSATDSLTPKIVMATARMWWQAVMAATKTQPLPTHSGDWTDFWNFGAGSAAFEMSIAARARAHLDEADTLAALAAPLLKTARRNNPLASRARHRASANEAATVWMEHTWGADAAISSPDSEDTASMWAHKAIAAYATRSLSHMLRRDAAGAVIAALADDAREPNDANVALINPLPWTRVISGLTPASIAPTRGRNEDADASRHAQDRHTDTDLLDKHDIDGMWPGQNPEYVLPPTEVPGLGVVRVPKASLLSLKGKVRETDDAVVETVRHRIEFDVAGAGGIRAWRDHTNAYDWVDPTAGWAMAGYVYERVAPTQEGPASRQDIFKMNWASPEVLTPDGWRPDWPAERSAPDAVISHRVLYAPHGVRVTQHLRARGAHGPILVNTFLPAYADWVEISAEWTMGTDTEPQAAYLTFPFALPNAVSHVDVGVAMQPGRDQLPGVCMDYFTTQGYVDFVGESLGMTVAAPENPLFMLGGFHFGQAQTQVRNRPAWLIGWIVNNYWETNFRAHQPGRVRARYRLLPRRGPFQETAATRFAAEAAHDRPLMQKLGEEMPTKRPSRGLQPGVSLLRLPEMTAPDGPVMTRRVQPATEPHCLVIELYNTSDEDASAEIASGALTIRGAWHADNFGKPKDALPLAQGTVHVTLPSRRSRVITIAV